MHNILIPVDFSDATQKLVEQAAVIGSAFGSTVRLLHVAAPDPSFASSKSWPQEVRDELARELHTEHQELSRLASWLLDRGVKSKAMLARGQIVETVLEFAERTGTDLIVMPAPHQHTLADLLPRNILKGIIRQVNCPVMVIPPDRDEDPEESED
jgi:nucleotide-binding universal stress UspA family protein